MNEKCSPRISHTNFYMFYQKYYAPKLHLIDTLLKTMETPLTVAETAGALGLSEETVRQMMAGASLAQLDKDAFLTIMRNGESEICRLYQRELARGNKAAYDASDIAYIYGLLDGHVAAVFQKMGVKSLPARDIPRLLSQIFVFILY